MAVTMAKKKSAKTRREDLITMRCTAAFKAWLEGIAEKEDRSTSVIITRAFRAYAKENGYDEPPDR